MYSPRPCPHTTPEYKFLLSFTVMALCEYKVSLQEGVIASGSASTQQHHRVTT